jgi:hypothetical protein
MNVKELNRLMRRIKMVEYDAAKIEELIKHNHICADED